MMQRVVEEEGATTTRVAAEGQGDASQKPAPLEDGDEFAGISARHISRDRSCLNPWVATQKSVDVKASRSESQHSSALGLMKKVWRT